MGLLYFIERNASTNTTHGFYVNYKVSIYIVISNKNGQKINEVLDIKGFGRKDQKTSLFLFPLSVIPRYQNGFGRCSTPNNLSARGTAGTSHHRSVVGFQHDVLPSFFAEISSWRAVGVPSVNKTNTSRYIRVIYFVGIGFLLAPFFERVP